MFSRNNTLAASLHGSKLFVACMQHDYFHDFQRIIFMIVYNVQVRRCCHEVTFLRYLMSLLFISPVHYIQCTAVSDNAKGAFDRWSHTFACPASTPHQDRLFHFHIYKFLAPTELRTPLLCTVGHHKKETERSASDKLESHFVPQPFIHPKN